MQSLILAVSFLSVSYPLTAYAYVGPGLGLGVVGAILGVLLSIFLALVAIFWYPFKRLFGKGRKKKEKHEAE